tara:strand:+ start:111 stop:323 length:213 start_codon:yes stop_codon:yes gene_type:complete
MPQSKLDLSFSQMCQTITVMTREADGTGAALTAPSIDVSTSVTIAEAFKALALPDAKARKKTEQGKYCAA